MAYARPRPKCASAPIGSFVTTPGVIKNFLELGCGCAALVRRHISFATQVNGIESESHGLFRSPKLVRNSRGERRDCLGGVAALEGGGRMDHGQVVELHDSVFREALSQIARHPQGLSEIAGQSQRDGRYGFNVSARRERERRLSALF